MIDRNTVTFESPLHQRLWQMTVDRYELEETTGWIQDATLKESCKQLYDYILDGYEDILLHPEAYGVTPEMQPRDFAEEKQMDEILNFSYIFLLNPGCRSYGCLLDLAEECHEDCLLLENEVFDTFLKRIRKKIYNKIKIFPTKESFEKPYGRMLQRGLTIERGEAYTAVRHQVYPMMFLVAKKLREADLAFYTRQKRSPQYSCHLNFFCLQNEPLVLDLERVLYGLEPESRNRIQQLLLDISQLVKVSYAFHFMYTLSCDIRNKKRTLFSIHRGGSKQYCFYVPLIAPDTEEGKKFEQYILSHPKGEAVIERYLASIQPCHFCSQECMKRNAYRKNWLFFGKKIQPLIASCHFRTVIDRTGTFTESDYEYFKILIEAGIAAFTNKK